MCVNFFNSSSGLGLLGQQEQVPGSGGMQPPLILDFSAFVSSDNSFVPFFCFITLLIYLLVKNVYSFC